MDIELTTKQLDYYENYEARMKEADNETLRESFNHWAKCHSENLLSGRHDLILWSAHHLEIIVREQRRRAVYSRRRNYEIYLEGK